MELTVWNTAAAPFDGTRAEPGAAGRVDLEGLLPFPEVLRIRVVEGHRARRRVPKALATDFEPVTRGELDGCVVRAVALVEHRSDVEGRPPMLTLRELAEDATTAELMGRRGRQRMIELYDLKILIRMHETVYEEMLVERQARMRRARPSRR